MIGWVGDGPEIVVFNSIRRSASGISMSRDGQLITLALDDFSGVQIRMLVFSARRSAPPTCLRSAMGSVRQWTG